jgi:hypothetical protein
MPVRSGGSSTPFHTRMPVVDDDMLSRAAEPLFGAEAEVILRRSSGKVRHATRAAERDQILTGLGG